MKWTQAHSRNAVAAKARKRMESSEEPQISVESPKFAMRRAHAKWRVQIRDLEHGDSLTLSLSRLPWPNRFVDTDRREHSAKSIGKLVQNILSKSP